MTHDAERWSPSDELLDRFLAERTAPDERVAVEAWLARTPAGWRAVHALRQLRFGVERDGGQAELWQRIERRCREIMTPASLGHRRREELMRSEEDKGQAREQSARLGMKGIGRLGRQPLRGRVWSATAVFVLGLVVLVVGWPVGARHGNRHAAQPSLVYATGNGERATITLPDGGTVALNVASRLEVPVDYMAGNRTVRLVGEGLFTVPRHEGTPLTVLAGVTAARVLGTSFVVRCYATDTATMVAVRDGKVAVGTAVVTAAHLVEVGHTGVPHLRPSDASRFTFATGVLTLSGAPLVAAVVELDRWYDADIRLGSPTLATKQITGDFTAGSLTDLVGFLEFTMGVRVVRDGRVLTLFPRQ